VSIPAGKTSATLAFYLHIDTRKPAQRSNDTLAVQVLNSSGTLLATLATYSNCECGIGLCSEEPEHETPTSGKRWQIRSSARRMCRSRPSFVIDDIP